MVSPRSPRTRRASDRISPQEVLGILDRIRQARAKRENELRLDILAAQQANLVPAPAPTPTVPTPIGRPEVVPEPLPDLTIVGGAGADAPLPDLTAPLPTPIPRPVPSPIDVVTPEEQEGIRRRDAIIARQAFGGGVGDLPIPPFMPDVEPKKRLTPEEHRVQGNALPLLFAPLDVQAETFGELAAQIPKFVKGDFSEIEAPTVATEGFTAAFEQFGSRGLLAQIGLGIVTDPLMLMAAFKVPFGIGRAATRTVIRNSIAQQVPRAADDIIEEATDEVLRRIALPPSAGRTVEGAIPVPGQVSRPKAATTIPEHSLVIVTSQQPLGERLIFSGARSLRRASEALGQRADIQILPGNATAEQVDRAAQVVAREQPLGTLTTIPIQRRTAGGDVLARPSQKQFPRGLDPEDLDAMRRRLRQTESRIRSIVPGPRPNSPQNQRLRALQEQAHNLRQAITELQGPRIQPELDIPGVIRREAVARVTPVTTRNVLGPGVVRPVDTSIPPGVQRISQRRGREVPFEASTTEEAARFREAVRGRAPLDIDKANEVLETAVAHERTSQVMAGKPPSRPPGTAIGSDMETPPPRRPDIGLSDDLEIPTHENPSTGIMRKWEGARNSETLAMEEFIGQGRRTAKEVGIKNFTEETMRPVFSALHGSVDPDTLPLGLRRVFDDAKALVSTETEEMLSFLGEAATAGNKTLMSFDAANMASRFLAHPDYFPRLWKIPKDVTGSGGRLTSRPGFTRPRLDASFDELVDYGLTPLTWNPYDMMALRRIAGVEYRESIKLINRLKTQGKALLEGEAPDNWAVPRVPFFEGRPIPGTTGPNGEVLFTPRIAVEPQVKGFVESAFGRTPEMFVGNRNIVPTTRAWSQGIKRLKLIGSGFQHLDFAFRDAAVAFTPTAIIRGGPVRYPSLVARLTKIAWWPEARAQLRRKLLSDTPLYKDFAISPKMLVDEGLGVTGDISLITRELSDVVQNEIISGSLAGPALNRAKKMQQFFEAGLFDGVYRLSMLDSAQKFVIPAIRRQHPTWTPRQVAGESATRLNEMFSTLGRWQTVLKDPAFKEFMQTVWFSTNESEALIRQGLGTIKGPSKRFWVEWWAGAFMGLAALANIVNLSATGRPLPVEAYKPFNINDPYAPWKVGFNNRFLSPQVPFLTGRNDTPVYLDVVGQLDTVFRWLTDPVSAASARVNVVPRAIANLIRGETFFGEKLDSPQKKAAQLLIDVAAPIGATNVLGAVREEVPELAEVVPGIEPRLGLAGQLTQAAGVNIRSEPTASLLDREAQVAFGVNYADIEPYQKDLLTGSGNVAEELGLRRESAIERGVESSQFFESLEQIDNDRMDALNGLVKNLQDHTVTERQAIDRYFEIEDETRSRKDGASLSAGREFEARVTTDPNQVALNQYHNLVSQSIVNDNFVPGLYGRLVELFERRITPEQLAYIRRNTNRRPIPRELLSILPLEVVERIIVSREARQRHNAESP